MSIAKKKSKKLRNYGFKRPTYDETNYVLGGAGLGAKEILCPDRNWETFLPFGEPQKRSIETYSCTSFGTLNCIEILLRRLFLQDTNHSERFVAIGSGQEPDGNDPHKVAEFIRKGGLIEEKDLPFTDEIQSWQEYMMPNPLTKELTNKGKEWLNQYEFKHEYVWRGNPSLEYKQEKLFEALQYSPVGISVTAWRKKGDFYVKNEGDTDNHWTVLFGAKKGKFWLIYDSYADDDYIKKLDWNFDFEIAKLFQLKKAEKKTLWQRLSEFLKSLKFW